METYGEHAVVLGAGMGGLLAAKVLAAHYETVTVLERDALTAEGLPRRGVPQGGHGHTLLMAGSTIIEELFPGLLADLTAHGVPMISDDPGDIYFRPLDHALPDVTPAPAGEIHVPSRPLLEERVRTHLTRTPHVRVLDRCAVDGLRGERRVTGVRATSPDGVVELDADLVVDAMGSGARTPAWLDQLGYPRPEEVTVKADATYASYQLRMDPAALHEKLVLISASSARPKGLGMFRHENDMWDFSVFGVAGHKPPCDIDGMIEFVADFCPPHIVTALREAEPLTEPTSRRFPTSRWRRYDRMREFPDGLIVLGDAVCSLNPTYGQGMTTAALQADALATTLRAGAHDLPRRYFRAAAKPVRDTWNIAALADRSIMGEAAGRVPLTVRALAPLSDALLGAAEADPVVRTRFLQVFSLSEPPASLFTPATGLRIARSLPRKLRRSTSPPEIPGVRRSFVHARGVRFHVTESGSGTPVLALHGWPQHHHAYRDLLADPPAGLRIIAPDLPGYGWSGPPPHRWAKQDVAEDLLALLDELRLDRVLLVGHDWGGWIAHLLALGAPERFAGLLALNIAHPWPSPGAMARHLWRFAYQPPIALAGTALHQYTGFVHWLLTKAGVSDPAVARNYADAFRNPVAARAARDTYRTFLLHELPKQARHPERRKARVPIRALFGVDDVAIHSSLAAAETARAEDYILERVPHCGHFITDERPDLVRARLVALADEVSPTAR